MGKIAKSGNRAWWKEYFKWQKDYCFAAQKLIKARLDAEQTAILESIQHNRRTSVRSGTARGKDFVAALGSILFLHLEMFQELDDDFVEYTSTKVINTAPTGRQIKNIMMPEISGFFAKGHFDYMLGELMSDGIRWQNPAYKTTYLHGFKADDDHIEAWSGIHAENVMVVVTEASGIEQVTFDSIEGILQGNSRLVLIFNPNRLSGEAYQSQTSPLYKKFVLNCLNAPNVINGAKLARGEITEQEYKKLRIPGQVDYAWVDEKVNKPGWAFRIPETDVNKAEFDFQWNGNWYRPSDLFRVKVLGEFPKESEEQLIPLSWIESAQQRWQQWVEQGWKMQGILRIGSDIAGMGRDNSVDCKRWDDFVEEFAVYPKTSHMQDAGRIKHILSMHRDSVCFVDTIGEGAGVLSRLEEQGVTSAISCKFSEGARGLKDVTDGNEFVNMRAYLYWCVRDWLNPQFGSKACLPPDDELAEELTSIEYKFNSNGKIQIEEKDEIKKKLGRSPDKADALAQTFYPHFYTANNDLTGMFH